MAFQNRKVASIPVTGCVVESPLMWGVSGLERPADVSYAHEIQEVFRQTNCLVMRLISQLSKRECVNCEIEGVATSR